MSMISEQVKELRHKADVFEKSGFSVNGIVKEFRKAADTIEELSAKLAAANMERSDRYYNGGWIPCSKSLPENDSYILVSFENFSLPDIGRYEEDKEGGAFYPGDEDKSYSAFGLFVNAWQPLPESYKGEEEE